MRLPINGIKKESISITLDQELLDRLKVKAEKDDRSLSQYINRVLKLSVRGVRTGCRGFSLMLIIPYHNLLLFFHRRL